MIAFHFDQHNFFPLWRLNRPIHKNKDRNLLSFNPRFLSLFVESPDPQERGSKHEYNGQGRISTKELNRPIHKNKDRNFSGSFESKSTLLLNRPIHKNKDRNPFG